MPKQIYDFSECLNRGKRGEEIICNYLYRTNIKNYPELKIYDVSDDEGYQKQDIDIVFMPNREKMCFIEIKTDSYISNNLFFEVVSNVQSGKIGCMLSTKADFLFYLFEKTQELFILNMKRYKSFVIDNVYKYRLTYVSNVFYDSLGILIPKDQLISQSFCKLVHLNEVEDNVKNL